jgi:hypothetical protein
MLTRGQKVAISAWICCVAALAFLILFQAVSAEYFLILSLISFLIISELYGPFLSRPKWKTGLNIVLIIGVLLFMVIVVEKVLLLLNS